MAIAANDRTGVEGALSSFGRAYGVFQVLVAAFVAFALLTLSGFLIQRARAATATAKAEVAAATTQSTVAHEGRATIRYATPYTFQYGGKSYAGVLHDSTSYKKGEFVRVEFDPADPSRSNRAGNARALVRMASILIFIAIAGLVWSLFIYSVSRQRGGNTVVGAVGLGRLIGGR